LVIFDGDGHFLALQMVNFSSLHDEGRPSDVFYHHRRNTLVNALPMAVISLILASTTLFIGTFTWLADHRCRVLCGESRYKSERQREKLSAAQFCGTAPTSL
jgi:hypothetical protein